MSAIQPSASFKVHRKMIRHNRWISVLRIAVPGLGLAVVSVPVLQFMLAGVVEALPFAGARLQSDTLVIEGPRFDGRTPTGTIYSMTAERSESAVGDLDVSDLHGLDIALTDGEDYWADIQFSTARWVLSRELLTSNEDVFIIDSTGMEGVMAGVEVDWPGQIITSEGPVGFDFGDESRLDAQTLFHDIAQAHWRFTAVSLTMTPAPDAGEERDPFAQTETP